jgi:hypothetical protein
MRYFEKVFHTLVLSMTVGFWSSMAFADYTFVVPQKPGGGTTVWTEIVAKELEPFLGEKINIKTIPGARDIPGFNEFHNNLRFDDKTVMVSHGGNGVSFLQEEVDYDYRDYESVGLMNLNIIAGKSKGDTMDKPRFAAGSGMVPEAFAFTMLTCGPRRTVIDYVACFNENVTWVKGMSTAERRLAFKRGELNGTRENPAAYKKHVEADNNAELWFHHGILQADGSHADDPNYPGYQFEELYYKRWGQKPSGDFYNAYKLVKSFRDGMQKALWVNKGNPNKQKLIDALTAMSKDPKAIKNIQKKVGKYEWKIGADGDAQRDTLMTFVTPTAMNTLVTFNKEALGLASVLKVELASK